MIEGTRLRSAVFRKLLGAGTALSAALLVAAPAAHAFNPPAPIKIDGGPLGPLQLSGGADGFAYALTGTGDKTGGGLLGTDKSVGVEFMNGLVELQKSDGLIQGTIEVGATNNFVLGAAPTAASIQTFSTGPLYEGYLTLAPSPNFSISAGQLGSLEGYESGIEWNNFNVLTTDIFSVENSQSTGVEATGTFGPLSGTVEFGDGFDTQQWSYLQASATYTANSNNVLTVFGATNLATIGAGAKFYGNANLAYNSTANTVGARGLGSLVNSSMVGAYYSWTMGNLNIVPEAQYTWVTKTPSVGVADFSSNLGLAVFADYQFGKSPYSLGGFIEYFSNTGQNAFFLNPRSQGFGISLTPTWQGKYLFVRGDIGWIHLTSLGDSTVAGYAGGYGGGAAPTGRDQATFLIETGVLF